MSGNGNETKDYIREIIEQDIEAGTYDGRVHTRFPPEPNGYLHIGHAKAIYTNFSIAEEYDGKCNLRFDDTNPVKEETEYVESMKRDIHWLGFDWDGLYYASDYFEQLYQYAVELIEKGKAFVCDLTPEQVRDYRGSLTEPGRNSPYRDRTVEENLDLFRRMRAGEFEDGARTLRAKIDMSSPNLNMRDPIIYRILHEMHHRTGDEWCIYPMYDYAHPLSDAIENITHSLCSLEFQDHRPLYNWFLEQLEIEQPPKQREFARLNLSYTVMSKRRLGKLIEMDEVSGWDDPRMPTLSGLRRRGYVPQAIRTFCDEIGLAKSDSIVDLEFLEHFLRDELNQNSPRRFGVLRPLRVVIENYPEDQVEWFEVPNHPWDEGYGTREVPFSRVVYIEREDFREDPPKKYYRLTPGREVRLMNAYFITCEEVVKDEDGTVVELRCSYDPQTQGGAAPDGRKVKGTLHWVSAQHALDAEVRLYGHLFTERDPYDVEEGGDWLDNLNPNSIEALVGCKVEPSLAEADVGARFQFMRKAYVCIDPDSTDGHLVFNRTVELRDTWAKIRKRQKKK